MAKSLILICLLISLAAVQLPLFGDVVYLNNGRKVEGKIIEETDEVMTLEIKIGKVVFRKDEIESIEKEKLPPDFFEDKTSGGVSKETQAAGQERAEERKFKLDIKAHYKESPRGDAIVVEGTTDLPPRTILWFTLKSSSLTIQLLKVVIRKSPFMVKMGQSDTERITPGSYVVEAFFSPERQKNEQVKRKVRDFGELTVACEVTVGTPDEVEDLVARREADLVSRIKAAGRIYNEISYEYKKQKSAFNKAEWDASVAQWQSKLSDDKSLIMTYRIKSINFAFTDKEGKLGEIVHALEMLIKQYTYELYKANHLDYNLPAWAKTKDTATLNKNIQKWLADLNSFAVGLEKKQKEE